MPVGHVGLSRGPRPFPNGFRTGTTTTPTPVPPFVLIPTGPLTTSRADLERDTQRTDRYRYTRRLDALRDTDRDDGTRTTRNPTP